MLFILVQGQYLNLRAIKLPTQENDVSNDETTMKYASVASVEPERPRPVVVEVHWKPVKKCKSGFIEIIYFEQNSIAIFLILWH